MVSRALSDGNNVSLIYESVCFFGLARDTTGRQSDQAESEVLVLVNKVRSL